MLLTKQHVTPSDPYELADRLYPKLAKQIRAALDALSDSSLEAIEIPESVQEALRNIYAQIAAATAAEAAPLVGVAFNSVNPRVVSWAERHVGNLITQITEESKQAIRDAITESLRQGLGAQPAARTLRPFLGLNGPQARALARFAGAFGEEPTVTQQRLIERRARRMLRQRAETVARTELITAANMGQQATWDAAADEGLIPRSALKEWVAAEDDRTCPYCMAMDGTRVAYNDDYTVPTRFDSDGGVLTSVASKTPPAHPRCRCAMILVEVDTTVDGVQFSEEAMEELDADTRRIISDQVDALNRTQYGDVVRIREVRTRTADLFNPDHYDDAFATVELLPGSADEAFIFINPKFAPSTDHVVRYFGGFASAQSLGPKFVATGASGRGLVGMDAAKHLLDRTITHEYGHVVQSRLARQVGGKDVVNGVTRLFREASDANEFGGGYLADGWPSLYSAESPAEMFAEAFADLHHNGANASRLSVEIGRLINRAMSQLP